MKTKDTDTITIRIPSSSLERDERISLMSGEIEKWVCSEAMERLLSLSGGSFGPGMTLAGRIEALSSFAGTHWELRNGREREAIMDNVFVREHCEDILSSAEELGFVAPAVPEGSFDMLLPLGGFRSANYRRVQLASRCARDSSAVVSLSGMRALNPEKERPVTERYAPSARTEYDVMNSSLESVFSLGAFSDGEGTSSEGWEYRLRRYAAPPGDGRTYCSLGLKNRGGARARTTDTLDVFFGLFRPEKHTRLLLLTSMIVLPYHTVLSAGYAIDHGVDIALAGAPRVSDNPPELEAAEYLQEIKATCDSILRFSRKYLCGQA